MGRRDDAEEVAWSAKGVNQAINNLIVEEEEFALQTKPELERAGVRPFLVFSAISCCN
jgi:hypothetical protein